MAIEIGGVRVSFGANVGEFMRGSKQVGREMDTLGRRIMNISNQINRASVLITTGMFAAQRFANAASGIFRVASAFEKGMSNVATLIDTSSESLARMSDEVLKIGQRTPVTLADLTTGLYDIRSAGIDAADQMRVLEGSARLAVAGLGTTQEAVDLVTSSLNAFGLEGQDAADVYNLIFKTVKAGKTTISALAQGFGAVAGTVAQAGIKLDDYLASVAALTTTGLPAAQAHTQIRAAIAGLLRETKETQALFEALGVKTFKQLVDQSGSVVVAFERIVRATRGNDAQLIKLLGSVEAYNALVGLAGKQNDAYMQTLESMRGGTDAVTEAFDKQNNTLNSTLQRLRNSLNSVATSIGTVLTPAINGLAERAANLAKAFTELSPETQELVARIIAIVGVVTPAIIALGFFANALASLIPVAGAIVSAFAVVTGAVATMIAATGPIGLFIVAAGTLTAVWFAFKDNIIAIWESISAFISDKIDVLIRRMEQFAFSISKSFELIKEGEFTKAWQQLGNTFVSTADQVQRANKTAQLSMGGWKTTLETTLPASVSAFKDGFVTPVGEGLSELEKLWNRHNEAARRFGLQTIQEIQSPIEAMIAQQQRLKEALDAGGLSAEQFGIAMQKATYVAQNAYAGMASDIAGSLQNVFGESKAFAIAQAIINTYEGFTKALAAYPPPFNYAAAAAVLASGFAQVANIKKTTKSSGGGGASGASSAAPGATQVPQKLIVQGIGANDLFTGSSVRGLAEQLLEYQRNGGQVVLR